MHIITAIITAEMNKLCFCCIEIVNVTKVSKVQHCPQPPAEERTYGKMENATGKKMGICDWLRHYIHISTPQMPFWFGCPGREQCQTSFEVFKCSNDWIAISKTSGFKPQNQFAGSLCTQSRLHIESMWLRWVFCPSCCWVCLSIFWLSLQ